MAARALLLNWVYYPPVGHAVEAFKIAKGFAVRDPSLKIHVLLNSRTTVELAAACEWIVKAWPIDLAEVSRTGDSAACLIDIPRTWDYIVNDHRPKMSPFPFADDLRTFHDLAETHFSARLWRGHNYEVGNAENAPAYHSNATIRMRVPVAAGEWVKQFDLTRGPNICVLLGGSSHDPIYPKLDSWRTILTAVQTAFPTATLLLTGKTIEDDRSRTYSYTKPELLEFFRSSKEHARTTDSRSAPKSAEVPLSSDGAGSRPVLASPELINCFDIGLWNQLALIEACDLLLAPHSGFAFLGPSVGTPWLTLSGVRWPECFFNDVPFYSVLPDCRHYPCWRDMKLECQSRIAAGTTVLCMDDQIEARIPDLLAGVRLLLDPNFSYQEAWRNYRQRIELMQSAQERFFQIT